MKIDPIDRNIEMNFETLTGFSFHGLVGIIVGLIAFFSYLIKNNKSEKTIRPTMIPTNP
jgi:hypothetical protein